MQEPDFQVDIRIRNPSLLTVTAEDVYVQLFIEDQFAFEATIEHLQVPAGRTITKRLSFPVTEAAGIYGLINSASRSYGGEVKVTVEGNADVPLLFLTLNVPFSSTSYVGEPSPSFESAEWDRTGGGVGQSFTVHVHIHNPARQTSLTTRVRCEIRRDIPLWFDETVSDLSSVKSVSAGTTTTLSFSFSPTMSGTYHFDIYLDGVKIYTQPDSSPPRLRVG